MEADLLRFYGIDYRDRWRRDEHGRCGLTLRRLWVLIHHMPPGSALERALLGFTPLSTAERLQADTWAAAAHSKSPHPLVRREQSRLRRQPVSTDRRRKLADARRRRRARVAAIERGEIT